MISRSLQIALGVLIAVTVALGIYTVKLMRHAEDLQTGASDTAPIAPPTEGPASTVTLVVARDDDFSLVRTPVTLATPQEPSMRVQSALRALLAYYVGKDSPHMLGAGSDVKDVYMVGKSLAVVDFNIAFAERHRSGIMVENLTLNSVIQTIHANAPDVRQVRFLVEGKDRDTLAGHADLRMTYDVAVSPAGR
jgi:hypothetical protein